MTSPQIDQIKGFIFNSSTDSIMLKGNLEDANIFMIRRMFQLAISKDTQTQLLRAILANKFIVLEKEFKTAPEDNIDDVEPESFITSYYDGSKYFKKNSIVA